jgi:DHA1 family bicyclomycin/chloramphenicol resistance-like MFS transporter
MAALFAYVATSAFVLQSMNGLSPIAYSVDFAANAGGMTVAALVAARLAGLVPTRKIILFGQVAALAAGVAMLVGALWFETPLLLAIVCFFVLMTAQGLIGPNGGALASAEVPEHPGTGSALLGCVQWVVAGTVAPIAGLGGETTAVPLALLMVGGAAVSMVGLLVLARPPQRGQPPSSLPAPEGPPRKSSAWQRLPSGGGGHLRTFVTTEGQVLVLDVDGHPGIDVVEGLEEA